MWVQHPSVQIYRSFDLGFSPDPAYCLWIAHVGDRYVAFKEKLWKKTIAAEIAADIVAESDGMRVSATFCDPVMDIKTAAAVRTIKDIFEDNGVPMDTSINNRELYAHYVHSALQEEVAPGVPKLQILERTGDGLGCPYLIKTIPQQRYDPKHPLRMADNRNDHAVIALAYFLISTGATERRPAGHEYRLKPWQRPKKQKKHSYY